MKKFREEMEKNNRKVVTDAERVVLSDLFQEMHHILRQVFGQTK